MDTLVNARAGSHLYGLNRPESDEDSMGIGVMSFEQATSLNQPVHEGDDDHRVYELKRWVKLAMGGNPTVMQMLWAPQSMWMVWETSWQKAQQDLQQLIPSQKCRASFRGYLKQQKDKMLSNRQQRPELIAKHGFDTKFAMHAVRLGCQGVEVLLTGNMTLPMPPEQRELCRDIRDGKHEQAEVLRIIDSLDAVLEKCSSVLPPEPDEDKINQWLTKFYKEWWRL